MSCTRFNLMIKLVKWSIKFYNKLLWWKLDTLNIAAARIIKFFSCLTCNCQIRIEIINNKFVIRSFSLGDHNTIASGRNINQKNRSFPSKSSNLYDFRRSKKLRKKINSFWWGYEVFTLMIEIVELQIKWLNKFFLTSWYHK